MGFLGQYIKPRNQFTFETDLDKSIYRVIDRILNSNPYAFLYRGRDLRYAVAKAAYYHIVNNKSIRNLYLYGPLVKGRDNISVQKMLYKKVILDLCELKEDSVNITVNISARIKYSVFFILSKLFRLLLKNVMNGEKISRKNSSLVMLTIANTKFYKYLKPIIDRFDVDIAFYQKIACLKIEEPYSEVYVSLKDYSKIFCLKQISKELAEFSGLILLCEKIFQVLSKKSPGIVLLSEGNSPEDELVSQMTKVLNIPTICIQHGWNPVIHCGFQNLNFSSFVTWGDEFQGLLQGYSPDQSFSTCGHHRLKQGERRRTDAVGFFLQSPERFISRYHWDQMIRLVLEISSLHPMTTIIVREHPNYKIDSEDKKMLQSGANIQITNQNMTDLDEDLDRCVIAVSIFSSVLLESLAKGVIPVIFNSTDMPRYIPDLGGLHCGYEAKTLDEAKKILNELIINTNKQEIYQNAMKENLSRYFSALGNNALKNISSHIHSFL